MQLPPLSSLLTAPSINPGINYGGYTFSEPRTFPPIFLASFQGIYAIMVPDTRFRPRPFRLLYIGESSDLNNRLTDKHEKLNHWQREANGQVLYCAYHMTTVWTEQQRKDVEEALIKQYNPPCNILLRSLLAPPVLPPKKLW